MVVRSVRNLKTVAEAHLNVEPNYLGETKPKTFLVKDAKKRRTTRGLRFSLRALRLGVALFLAIARGTVASGFKIMDITSLVKDIDSLSLS